MARAIVSAAITFGLVTIPVKLYTSASSEQISFNMITPDGSRVKQKLVHAVTGEEVDRDALLKGYEAGKDQFVTFTKDEMKALETASDGTMVIKEFVDASSLDPVAVEKTYYLGPDKGGDRGYSLLAETMKAMGKIAVAMWSARGKDQLVVVRPHGGGLLLHIMFYANEVRPFAEVLPATVSVSDAEREMAAKLIGALSTGAFDPSKYEDGYAKRVKTAVEHKLTGVAPSVTPVAPVKNVMDLLDALKASLGQAADNAVQKIVKKGKA